MKTLLDKGTNDVCLNCFRASQMSPRSPRLGWCIYRTFRVRVWCFIAHLSRTLWKRNCAHEENGEMGEQCTDFKPKHLGHVALCQVVLVYQVNGHKPKYFLHHESNWNGLLNDLCIHLPKKALGQRGLSAHSPRRVGGDPQWRVNISLDAHLFRSICTGVFPSQVKVMNTGQKNSTHGECSNGSQNSLVGSVRCQTEP